MNSSRLYLKQFVEKVASSLQEGSIILDAGAGNCPYKDLFNHVKYESADFCQVDKEYGVIDYVCDLSNIPVEDARYDAILLNQVMEHLPEPENVLKELYRVLKKGGQLCSTAPFFYEEHEVPYDFYRYTQFGYKHLLEKVGFKVETISWLEGYYGTLSYQLEVAARSLPTQPQFYGDKSINKLGATIIAIVAKPLFKLLAIFYAHQDLKYKVTTVGLCKNYAVIARKV